MTGVTAGVDGPAGAMAGTRRVVLFADGRAFGGAERMVVVHATRLRQRGWAVTVLHRDEPGLAPLARTLREADIESQTVPRSTWIGVVGFVRRALLARDAQVLHVHRGWPAGGSAAIVAGAVARVPAIVVTDHLFLPIGGRRLLLQRGLTRLVDRVIAVSEAVREGLVGLGIPADRIRVVRNGIEAPPGPAPVLTGGPGVQVLGVGRLEPQKGWPVLLDAMARLPGVTCTIAGDGSLRGTLEEQAGRLGLLERVRLVGFRNDIGALLAAAEVVVLPSLQEGMPLVLLEALAAGRPVVASAIPGVTEVVADGLEALLVRPNDPAALAAGIERLLADRALAERLGAAGRDRVLRDHGADAMVGVVEACYREILAGSASRRAARSERRWGRRAADARDVRLADWRFFLARPRVARVAFVGPAEAGAPDALGAVALVGVPGAELVVVTRRTARRVAETARSARARVAAHGCLALVIRRPFRGPAAVRADLEAAGFSRVACVAAWPTPARARWWLPLSAASRPPGSLDGEEMSRRRGLAWRAWRAAVRAGLAPLVVLAWNGDEPEDVRAVVPAIGPAGYLAHEAFEIRRRAAGADPGEVSGARVSLRLRVSGTRASNRVVGLVGPEDGAAMIAVKLPRTGDGGPSIEREASILEHLERRGLPDRLGLPRLISYRVEDRVGPLAAQSVVPGARPIGLRRLDRAGGLVRRSGAWLGTLAVATDDGSAGARDRRTRDADAILDRFATAFAPLVPAGRLGRLRASLRELDSLPVVVEHRDLGPWNLLDADDGTLGVTDWESAVEAGWPLLDLLYLIDHVAFAAAGARTVAARVRAARDVRAGVGPVGVAGRDAIQTYLGSLGLDPAIVPPLRGLCATVHALSEHRRLAEAHQTPSTDELARGLFWMLWHLDAPGA